MALDKHRRDSRDSFVEIVLRTHLEGIVVEAGIAFGAGAFETMLDITLGFLGIHGADMARGDHPLPQLLHVRALQDVAEFRLPDEEALEQRMVAELEIRQHAQFLDGTRGQILGLVDDEQAALALARDGDQEGLQGQAQGFTGCIGEHRPPPRLDLPPRYDGAIHDVEDRVAVEHLQDPAKFLHALRRVAKKESIELPPVVARVPGIGFDSAHNRNITWAHLLEQTSEWEGACFGLPDTVDRYRTVSHDPRPPAGVKGDARPLQPPGTYWEYNDVRINQLSLALLHLFRQPLPEVFLQSVLQPLGGGEGFRWEGYDDAWTEVVDASGTVRHVQSVPGGTHWGGGVSISARDQALVANLMLIGGRYNGEEIVSWQWLARMSEPCAIAPFYGRLMWLNRDGRSFPGASTQAGFMIGAGGHYVWIEPAHEAVVVVRWLDSAYAPGFVERMAAALSQR